MDRGKRATNRNFRNLNNTMYLDLQTIIREFAIPFCPAKSLFRFMGVCRDWKLQISTPFFAHKQSNSFNVASGVFSQSAGNDTSFISLDSKSYGVPDPSLKFLPEEFDIRSSSNGLVCCQGRSEDRAYYICNPVTKQWKKLSKPSVNHGAEPAVVLVFKPSRLNFVAEYKLVCVFSSVDMNNGHEFEIYSSSSDSWEVSGELIFGNWKVISKPGLHVNDVVYWQTHGHGSGILAFDLLKERAQVISSYYMGNSTSIGVIDGKLGMFALSRQTLSVHVLSNVHTDTMGSYGATSTTGTMHSRNKTWEDKYKITLNYSVVPGFSFDVARIVLGSEVVMIRSGKTVIAYSLKTKEAVVLSSDVEPGSRFTPYVNSLVYF